MVGYLQGRVLSNDGKNILLLVQSTGYELIVPTDTAATCAVNKEVELYTHLHVREEELSLFGFESREKLQFFKLLLTVSGVGPKMGIELLSLPVQRLKQAIVSENKTFLTTVKGMGDKLASRLILELKNKVKVDTAVDLPGSKMVNPDVVEALERLGYDRGRVVKMLQTMTEEIQDEQELIRYALRNL